MPLKVSVEDNSQGTYIIHCEGSIDSNTHTILGAEVDAILEKTPVHVVFDMKDVNYISSAGVSVVLAAEQWLKMNGKKALLVNLQPQIRKVFDIVKALPDEQIFASVAEMDNYLNEMQRRVKKGEI